MFKYLIDFVRDYYGSNDLIPLHSPVFVGKEEEFVKDTISSTYVSSIGSYVKRFEKDISKYTSSPASVAVVNGTAALHIALLLVGVKPKDLVITQPLTFVATVNAINYCGADPVFLDVDRKTLSLCPIALNEWLLENTFLDKNGKCLMRENKRVVRACLPIHTFGHPAKLDELLIVCKKWNLELVEDAAESLGSFYKGNHTGTFGKIGTLSFNGNKIITTGGGGMLLTPENIYEKAKHITTTAKVEHPFEFIHDTVGYNYRLPNLNASLGCAQMLQLEKFIKNKRKLASLYLQCFIEKDVQFINEPVDCRSNYWLNGVICEDKKHRDSLLKETNSKGVMTRPVWRLMTSLPMYQASFKGKLTSAEWLEDRIVNLPSSVCLKRL